MAKYLTDMLQFAYNATLHLDHPTISPDFMTKQLKMKPSRTHAVGDERKTPKGNKLKGHYAENYWMTDLETFDGQDITEFLTQIVERLEPCRGFLRDVYESGGSCCCFIGVHTSKCCAHEFSPKLLGDLADLFVSLRLDVYGEQLPQQISATT